MFLAAAAILPAGCQKSSQAAAPAAIDSASIHGTYRSYIPAETGLTPMYFTLRPDGTATYIKDDGRYEVEGTAVFFVYQGKRVLGFTRGGPHQLLGNAHAKGVDFVRMGDALELKHLDEENQIRLNLRVLASLAHRTFASESLNGALGSGSSYKGKASYTIGELNSSPFLSQLKPVAGENYRSLSIPVTSPAKISVQTMDGRIVEYTY